MNGETQFRSQTKKQWLEHLAVVQVHRLLHSLQIDPRALPTQLPQGGWDHIFANGGVHPRDGRMVHDVVMQNRIGSDSRPAVDRCLPCDVSCVKVVGDLHAACFPASTRMFFLAR